MDEIEPEECLAESEEHDSELAPSQPLNQLEDDSAMDSVMQGNDGGNDSAERWEVAAGGEGDELMEREAGERLPNGDTGDDDLDPGLVDLEGHDGSPDDEISGGRPCAELGRLGARAGADDMGSGFLAERHLEEANAARDGFEKAGFADAEGDAPAGKLLKRFLPEELLVASSAQANRALGEIAEKGEAANKDEMLNATLACLIAGWRSASLASLFSKQSFGWLRQGFPIRKKRAMKILRALAGRGREQRSLRWEKKGKCAVAIGQMERIAARISAEFLLASKVIAAIDDDHSRLPAAKRALEEAGLRHMVNQVKRARGPALSACCSSLNGRFYAGRCGLPSETAATTAEIALQLMTAHLHFQAIPKKPQVIAAADRGCLCNDAVTLLDKLECGFLGAHKRAHNCPRCFGDGIVASRHLGALLSGKGAQSGHWASDKSGNGIDLRARACRESRNGGIAAALTSISILGPGRWALAPKDHCRWHYDSAYVGRLIFEPCDCSQRATRDAHGLLAAMNANLIDLTVEQSSCRSWRLLRAFRFASRASACLLRALGRNSECLTTSRRKLLALLGIRIAQEAELSRSESEALEILRNAAADDANAMKARELKHLLASLRQTQTGRKEALVAKAMDLKLRVENGHNLFPSPEGEGSSLEGQLEKAALEGWMLKPIAKTVGMVEGSLNEQDVTKRAPELCKRHSSGKLDALVMMEKGLICRRDGVIIAGSPDGVIALLLHGSSHCEVGGLEVKTMTSRKTLSNAENLARRHGRLAQLRDLGADREKQLFHALLLTPENRAQALHHAAALNCATALFVVAPTNSIIYAVDIKIPEVFTSAMAGWRMQARDIAFSWVGRDGAQAPQSIRKLAEKEAGCESSLLSLCALSSSLLARVMEADKPIPPTKHARPSVAAAWNSCKGGVDERSRELKELQLSIVDLPPVVAALFRLIKSQVWNALLARKQLIARQSGNLPRLITSVAPEMRSCKKPRRNASRACSFKALALRAVNEILGAPNPSPAHPSALEASPSPPPPVIAAPRLRKNALGNFNKNGMPDLRLSQEGHDIQRLKGVKRHCPLCSEAKNESQSSPGRAGGQAASLCRKRRVAACAVSREGQRRACWELLHKSKRLSRCPRAPRKRAASSRFE